jgi:hypothetical protein
VLDDRPVTVEEVQGFSNTVWAIMDQTLARHLDGTAVPIR